MMWWGMNRSGQGEADQMKQPGSERPTGIVPKAPFYILRLLSPSSVSHPLIGIESQESSSETQLKEDARSMQRL